jgi:hypothetical protein
MERLVAVSTRLVGRREHAGEDGEAANEISG